MKTYFSPLFQNYGFLASNDFQAILFVERILYLNEFIEESEMNNWNEFELADCIAKSAINLKQSLKVSILIQVHCYLHFGLSYIYLYIG